MPPALVRVVVARGRSIFDGRDWTAGPGDEIEVSAGDAALLMARGFVVDPNAPPPPVVRTELIDSTDNPSRLGLQRSRNELDAW